jgi:predicted acylesterase/phospholipase RssA
MRGIYSAAFLAGLMELFARERGEACLDLGKGFDLIVGTSTGAIIGCAAAVGEPMEKVVELYEQHGPNIFPIRLTDDWKVIPQLKTRPSYLEKGERALRSALKSVLGEQTIADVYEDRRIALAIPAVEMSQQRSWVFKTSHLGGHRDDRFKLVDVCMATSAAPIFRSLAAIEATNDPLGGHLVFADGGLWANNPVLVGLVDALKMASPGQPIEIFTLGTCPRPEGEEIHSTDVHRGLWGWKFGGKALQLSLSAQEYAFDNMARMLGGVLGELGRPVSVTRFPNGHVPPDTLQFLDIDDTRSEAIKRLKAQARADVSVAKSACDDVNNPDGQRIAQLLRDLPVRT